MKIYDVQQGTSRWSELRAGIPTSSQCHRIITPGGQPSEQSERYKMDLLAERMLGRPLEPVKTLPMLHGSMTEAEAVAWYELQRDITTTTVGFVMNDAGTWGSSPDRFVGNSGILEIKCPDAGMHMSYLLKSGSVYAKYKVQCAAQLWICEREFVDLMSYYPELPEALVRIERDEKFIAKLACAVEAFSVELERLTEYAKAQGWIEMITAEHRKRTDIPTESDLIKAIRDSLVAIKK